MSYYTSSGHHNQSYPAVGHQIQEGAHQAYQYGKDAVNSVVHPDHGGDAGKRHRCKCCCCYCCHIKTACIIILIVELVLTCIGIANAAGAITNIRSTASIAINSVEIVLAVLFLITIILAFAGIYLVNDKLVVPHIVMQVVKLIWRLVQMVIYIAALATGANWLANTAAMTEQQRWTYEQHKSKIIGGISGSYIALGVIGIILTIWFIMMFMKLRRYLKEERERRNQVFTMQGRGR